MFGLQRGASAGTLCGWRRWALQRGAASQQARAHGTPWTCPHLGVLHGVVSLNQLRRLARGAPRHGGDAHQHLQRSPDVEAKGRREGGDCQRARGASGSHGGSGAGALAALAALGVAGAHQLALLSVGRHAEHLGAGAAQRPAALGGGGGR